MSLFRWFSTKLQTQTAKRILNSVRPRKDHLKYLFLLTQERERERERERESSIFWLLPAQVTFEISVEQTVSDHAVQDIVEVLVRFDSRVGSCR